MQRRLARRVEALLPRDRPGEFNEALMELGETVCLPVHPRCPLCPVRRACRAYATLADPGELPRRSSARHARPHVRASVVVVERPGEYLLQQRPRDGLLGGLYEFPGGKIETGETPSDAARRELREETGIRARALTPVGLVRHAYSHFSVELHVFLVRLRSRPKLGRGQRWVARRRVGRLPLPKATEKILALLDDRSSAP